MISLQASTRPERRSPPKAPGFASLCVRAKAIHRLTLAALTPKRSAAAMRQARRHRRQDPYTKIDRKSCRHIRRPPTRRKA
jgi:hypothetical protein